MGYKKTTGLHHDKRKLQKLDKKCDNKRAIKYKSDVPTQDNHDGNKYKTQGEKRRERKETR